MVDANMRWSVDERSALRAGCGLDVYWLEEPTIPDVEGPRAHRARRRLPVAAGEPTRCTSSPLIRAQAVTFQADVTNCGGVTFMKVAHLAGHSSPSLRMARTTSPCIAWRRCQPLVSRAHGFSLDTSSRIRSKSATASQSRRPPRAGVDFDWKELEAAYLNPPVHPERRARRAR
jgi:hypothetical protein